jgi:bacillithiol system protein YtxJ
MNWKIITDENQLEEIREKSAERPQIIFKHSTRCSISSVAKSRLDRSSDPEGMDFYYLDLIRYRSISNKISELFEVHHESPQILLIKNGECIYDESHLSISIDEVKQQATA